MYVWLNRQCTRNNYACSSRVQTSHLHLGRRWEGLRRGTLRVPAPRGDASPRCYFLLLRRSRAVLGLLGKRGWGRRLLSLGTKLEEVRSVSRYSIFLQRANTIHAQKCKTCIMHYIYSTVQQNAVQLLKHTIPPCECTLCYLKVEDVI